MTKNKHDHTTTKKIKAWLFAIMLLLPFLFLLPTGLYYGLNQNAQLSERTENLLQYYEVTDSNASYEYDELSAEKVYKCNSIGGQFQSNGQFYEFAYCNIVSYFEEVQSYSGNNYGIYYDNAEDMFWVCVYDKKFSIMYNDPSEPFLFVLKDSPTGNSSFVNWVEDQQLLLDIQGSNIEIPMNNTESITYTNDISTSIINAWNSTWQNPLFSWTNYSPFYAPMQSFTNVFGINDMQIANVLTYLATITAIYIVFDIVIELFTYLTHLIPRSD